MITQAEYNKVINTSINRAIGKWPNLYEHADDLKQEAWFTLQKCIKEYVEGSEASFKTFFISAIFNMIFNYVFALNRHETREHILSRYVVSTDSYGENYDFTSDENETMTDFSSSLGIDHLLSRISIEKTLRSILSEEDVMVALKISGLLDGQTYPIRDVIKDGTDRQKYYRHAHIRQRIVEAMKAGKF